jgi:hypothetical protein
MQNLLLEKIEYRIDETPRGVWRRYLYPNGQYFAEFRTHAEVFGMPLLHFTRGICPETGRRVVARGFIAIGRMAVGVIALGQASAGVVAFGQAAFGLLFALAQASAGFVALGQLAVAVHFAAGQLAAGTTALGQLAIGKFVLAQIGFGLHRWTPGHADPIAIEHFRALWDFFRSAS